MRAEIKELWLELCEQAANEQDPDKLLVMVREINAALKLKIRRLKRSGAQLVPDAPSLPRCFLCGKSVSLDTSKSDENGMAIHEECYVLKMQLKRATSQHGVNS